MHKQLLLSLLYKTLVEFLLLCELIDHSLEDYPKKCDTYSISRTLELTLV
jgi:hypothetical protein